MKQRTGHLDAERAAEAESTASREAQAGTPSSSREVTTGLTLCDKPNTHISLINFTNQKFESKKSGTASAKHTQKQRLATAHLRVGRGKPNILSRRFRRSWHLVRAAARGITARRQRRAMGGPKHCWFYQTSRVAAPQTRHHTHVRAARERAPRTPNDSVRTRAETEHRREAAIRAARACDRYFLGTPKVFKCKNDEATLNCCPIRNPLCVLDVNSRRTI